MMLINNITTGSNEAAVEGFHPSTSKAAFVRAGGKKFFDKNHIYHGEFAAGHPIGPECNSSRHIHSL